MNMIDIKVELIKKTRCVCEWGGMDEPAFSSYETCLPSSVNSKPVSVSRLSYFSPFPCSLLLR